jgi:hypothetical protein
LTWQDFSTWQDFLGVTRDVAAAPVQRFAFTAAAAVERADAIFFGWAIFFRRVAGDKACA